MYKTFLAEQLLKAEQRIFDLNLQRENFIKPQFLYNNSDEQSLGKFNQRSNLKENLLIFLHREG